MFTHRARLPQGLRMGKATSENWLCALKHHALKNTLVIITSCRNVHCGGVRSLQPSSCAAEVMAAPLESTGGRKARGLRGGKALNFYIVQ